MNDAASSDDDRFPTLSPHGRAMLTFLREHPNAPIFRNESGNRLRAEDVVRVRAFEREVLEATAAFEPGTQPAWLAAFVARCYAEVPSFRDRGPVPDRFTEIPTTSRADLGRDVAAFVSDLAPLERLLNFRTSGTTGHPIPVPSHPVVAAGYVGLYKRALRRFGVTLVHGRGQVGVVLVGAQKRCFTYVSVTPTMDESGLVKLNLDPDDWRHPDDRARYLNALAPELVTGDPLAFAELLDLPLTLAPKALLSTSMALAPGLRAELEARFRCAVLDVYSMNEAGPIAVFDETRSGHALLQHRLLVEILDDAGRALPPGERGEITLTGGFNFCLPLLRYRTGDHARLERRGDDLVLVDLEGRAPIRFRTSDGRFINNIEVTHALHPFSIARFTLHQARDCSLTLRVFRARASMEEIERALRLLFGKAIPLSIEELASFDGKATQYTSELCPD